jgi:hypothetical protein
MPASLRAYADTTVEYETLPGWKEDISKAKSFEDLPKNCQVCQNLLLYFSDSILTLFVHCNSVLRSQIRTGMSFELISYVVSCLNALCLACS